MRPTVVAALALLVAAVAVGAYVVWSDTNPPAAGAPCRSGESASGNRSSPAVSPATAGWYGNATVAVQGDYLVVSSNGIPPEHGAFPAQYDPNPILPQNYSFRIPQDPQIAAACSPVPLRGPIALALDGVPFFGPYNAQGQDAVTHEQFDLCNGHPNEFGAYHYHQYSPCIEGSPSGEHSPLVGFAFDGFPIYGPNGTGGVPIPNGSLDACHGHYDPSAGEYVYVAETTWFPYVLGCYAGTPVAPY